jgi:hypothetical protein
MHYDRRMRFILVLLLSIALMAQAAAAQRSAHACCPGQDCIVQCVDMGCASAVPPLAPPAAQLLVGALPAAAAHAAAPALSLPEIVDDIWTPPD